MRRVVYGKLMLHFKSPNPSVLCENDIRTAYQYYSEAFFEGKLPTDIIFTVSSKMTSRAGLFSCVYKSNLPSEMKLSISSKLILTSFTEADDVVTMGGVKAYDRVSALQLVLEHEIAHILVMSSEQYLVGHDQKKKEYNPHGLFFRQIVKGYFGHTKCSHSLFGNRSFLIGQEVTFTDNESVVVKGLVVKINQFTVLVNCDECMYRVRHDAID